MTVSSCVVAKLVSIEMHVHIGQLVVEFEVADESVHVQLRSAHVGALFLYE